MSNEQVGKLFERIHLVPTHLVLLDLDAEPPLARQHGRGIIQTIQAEIGNEPVRSVDTLGMYSAKSCFVHQAPQFLEYFCFRSHGRGRGGFRNSSSIAVNRSRFLVPICRAVFPATIRNSGMLLLTRLRAPTATPRPNVAP